MAMSREALVPRLSLQDELGASGVAAPTDVLPESWGERRRLLGVDMVGAKVLPTQSKLNLAKESEEGSVVPPWQGTRWRCLRRMGLLPEAARGSS